MGRSLVIVESPNKAKTINKYLGRDFVVKSSKGHIRDLPTSSTSKKRPKSKSPAKKLSAKQREQRRARNARKALIERMGVNPDDHWTANYVISEGKENVVSDLKKSASSADFIYLATDMDREGEAIAWHLQEVIGGNTDRYLRVVFNEITENAIKKAFEFPGKIDDHRVNAQQARRFLDRVVGFELTPLLYSKMARGLSAGRVQSVAVRLVVEREREIRAFDVEEYWDLFASLDQIGSVGREESNGHRFKVVNYQEKAFRAKNEEEATSAEKDLKQLAFKVQSHEKRPTSSSPSAPFTTSTLQQAASTRLGFSVRKTMNLAQRLYEGGLITYMRTDSTNLSSEAVENARTFLKQEFGSKYVPDKPNEYATKSRAAQEAHEAIRPSSITTRSETLTNLERDQQRLYDLIWRRFAACQMTRANYESVTTSVKAGDYELRIRGRVLLFDGFTRVFPPRGQSEDLPILPEFKVGEILTNLGIEKSQHFTKPPARYSEATLVSELEKRGIGRPSTYVPIISTIQDRGYVTLRQRRFHAERIGELVTDRLIENFSNLMEYEFTANLEEELDLVALGHKDWQRVLNSFYGDFSERLEIASDRENGMRPNEPTNTSIPCNRCGRKMMIRTASTGIFLGCEGYSLPPKERCSNTMNLIGAEEIDLKDDEAESRLLRQKKRCSICDTPMDSYLLDEKRKLHVCGSNPDCPGHAIETGEFQIRGYEGPVVECDKCGADMQLRSGRFGKYFACTSESCANTRKLLKNGEVAPPRADPIPMPELLCDGVDDFYVLRDGAAGLFLAASKFPRNRITRAPLVSEIILHANELDAKFKHLLTAPVADPDGNPTMIRFSRKSKEHYVSAGEKNRTWNAYYRDGRWVPNTPKVSEQLKRKRSTRKAVRRTK